MDYELKFKELVFALVSKQGPIAKEIWDEAIAHALKETTSH